MVEPDKAKDGVADAYCISEEVDSDTGTRITVAKVTMKANPLNGKRINVTDRYSIGNRQGEREMQIIENMAQKRFTLRNSSEEI